MRIAKGKLCLQARHLLRGNPERPGHRQAHSAVRAQPDRSPGLWTRPGGLAAARGPPGALDPETGLGAACAGPAGRVPGRTWWRPGGRGVGAGGGDQGEEGERERESPPTRAQGFKPATQPPSGTGNPARDPSVPGRSTSHWATPARADLNLQASQNSFPSSGNDPITKALN